jgi:uncharacterized membrane protein YfcA
MPVSLINLISLIIIFFLTSAIGVVTGSNSLITVPVMFQFGIDSRVAVATNMFGLLFMSIGGAIPFIRKGIYGGLYSGGYVTMLTAAYVALFGMTFTEAVANTKIINVFSSLVATMIFAWQGLIDYKLGLILGATMFVAAYVGAFTVTKLNDLWLKRIFLATVLILAVKIIFDLVWK